MVQQPETGTRMKQSDAGQRTYALPGWPKTETGTRLPPSTSSPSRFSLVNAGRQQAHRNRCRARSPSRT